MSSNLDNEKELLTLLSRDSEYAFAVIFDHYRPKVLGTAMKLLKDVPAAEEVVQDVFLKLWLKRHEMEPVTNLHGFIGAITRNLVFDRFRKKVHEITYRMSMNGAEPVINDTDHRIRTSLACKLLQHAIDQLPLRQRQVYEMVRVQGLSMDEISQKLSISKSTAKGHLTAALQRIRTHLNAHAVSILTVPLLVAVFQHS
ncbi:MAG TPA: sigma-70 family RNA polymerase sigma factor [Chitinophaga sp.]|uniref:RNA polymerase sigma factor n=1 Tax=Chitinophaga sp. TaxID=1869181 RepID=UPI002DB9E621|nr:sigma-70 family RNA polymerase sigma factor [Chitinophaga sp.]HEU4552337.1 sigma-70 family RNA polymerase sigma factor [Chitinophaga sp.]